MYKYLSLALLTFLFLIPSPADAQIQGLPPGLQYNCVKMDWCHTSGNCSTNHVHRARLSTEDGHTATPSRTEAFLTECIEYVPPGENTPTTVCTTGSDALDNELFCNNTNCNYFSRLSNDIQYSISRDDTYGIYQFNTASNSYVKTGPAKIATDAQGKMIPATIEWQSYTPQAHERKFLIWGRISQSSQSISSVDPGQKQATLTWPSLSEICSGETWDPEGIVYDAETGIPLDDVRLNVKYSATETGIFEDAKAGIGEVLPPGTLPLMTRLAGFYMFYGLPGYYTIQPEFAPFEHMNANQVTISPQIRSFYKPELNYYADSRPILERAGQRQIKNIPMVLQPGQTRPAFNFQVKSHTENVTLDNKLAVEGRVNAPAVIHVEICSTNSGILNCRNKKEYRPGNGGPIPATNFRYSFLLDQKELASGEKYTFTYIPAVTVTSSTSTSLIDRIMGYFGQFIPSVSAQEPQTIRIDVEPIPRYIEGFAYDSNGLTIPNALVEVYVSFSGAPVFTTQADERGYFQITSEFLPRDPYTISYRDPAGIETILTTSQFLAQNNEFMLVENVDPYRAVTEANNPRAQVTPQFEPRTAQAQSPSLPTQAVQPSDAVAQVPTDAAPQTQGPSALIVAAMVFGGLVIATIAVVIYVMKRRREEPMNMG